MICEGRKESRKKEIVACLAAITLETSLAYFDRALAHSSPVTALFVSVVRQRSCLTSSSGLATADCKPDRRLPTVSPAYITTIQTIRKYTKCTKVYKIHEICKIYRIIQIYTSVYFCMICIHLYVQILYFLYKSVFCIFSRNVFFCCKKYVCMIGIFCI